MKKVTLTKIVVACATLGLVASLSSCNNAKNTTTTTSNAEVTTSNAAQGSVVFFNLDKVIAEYDMANELKSSVEAKIKGIQDELTRRGNKLQSEFNTFNDKLNKGLITRSVAEVQGAQLQQKQNEFNQYAAQKQQEMAEEQQVMLNQIGNAIKEFVDKFNQDKKYALILSTQGDILPAPVVAGDAAYDITNDIIIGINKEYTAIKAKGGKPTNNSETSK